MAALYAKENRWNDALLFNAEGFVCDSTIANLFLVKQGVVYTPSLKQGCVAGVMRMLVIKMLKEKNIQLVEEVIEEKDLMEADEVFLTNSIYEIRWVKQIHDRNYQNEFVKQIYMDLRATIL
jgi:branched-chain amino acid aminotransferase